jgi:hypothetical protein
VDPNEETLVPFLTAFANAAALMPSLKEVALWSPLTFNVPQDLDAYEDFDTSQVSNFVDAELAWGVAYTAPGVEAFTTVAGEDFSKDRQIWWKVGKWRPDPEQHRLFQQIGRGKHGEALTEYWDDDYSGDGLGIRDWFRRWESHRWCIDP